MRSSITVGPSALDRIVAINVIGTKTAVLLVVIGAIFGRVGMFVDFALAYLEKNERSRALGLLAEGRRRYPKSYTVTVNSGTVYANLGEYDEATAVGEALVVRMEGNLDTNTSETAHEFLSKSIADGASNLVVSLDAVDFVSSAGLRVLLATAKRLGGSGGSLRVCGLNETVNEVFEISGFNTILDVSATESDAVAGF